MGDLAIVAVLLAMVLLGMRRGFFKELVGAAALVGATVAATRFAPHLGSTVAQELEASVEVGYTVAGAAIWCATYLVVQLIGRAVFARLKAEPKHERDLGDAARGAVGSLFRTLDTVLGAGLGLAKGGLLAALVLYAGLDVRVRAIERQFDNSVAAGIYRDVVAPAVASRVPEFQVARSFGTVRRIAALVRKHPDRFDRLGRHPALQGLTGYQPVLDVIGDPECQAAFKERRLDLVLRHPKVLALVKNREAMQKLGAVDVVSVQAAIDQEAPPAYMFPAPHDAKGTVAVDGGQEDPRYPEGATVVGKVRWAMPYGLVIELGHEAFGLLRPEDLSWSALGIDLAELFPEGSDVRAKVLEGDSDPEGRVYVALGRKQLTDDPWDGTLIQMRLRVDSEQDASVLFIGTRYVLVELDGEVEATIPSDDLALWKLRVLRPGDTIEARVKAVDDKARTVQVRPRGDQRRVNEATAAGAPPAGK